MKLKLFILVLISSIVVFRISYNITQKNELILPKNLVNDWADIITVDGVFEIDSKLSQIEAKTKIRMVVVTLLPGGDGISNTEYMERVFPMWNQTLKEPDSGIMLIVSIKDGKVILETGAKLKYLIDKEFQEKALSSTLIPELLKGPTRCDKGFIDLITLIEEKLNQYHLENIKIKEKLVIPSSGFTLYQFIFERKRVLIFACVVFLIILLIALKIRKKRKCPACSNRLKVRIIGNSIELSCPECGYMKKETH